MRWSDRSAETRRHLVLLSLVLAMAVAVGINLAQFRAIEEETRHNYRALHAYDTEDIYEIAIGRDSNARRWVAPFHYFGQLYPGSTIVVPEDALYTWFPLEEALVTLGRAENIERHDYDTETLTDLTALSGHRTPASEFAPHSDGVQDIIDNRVGFYSGPQPSGIFVIIAPDGPPGRDGYFAFVDVALLDEQTGRFSRGG